MHTRKINDQLHVSFDCQLFDGFSTDKYFNINTLDGMYCLVLNQLRDSIRTNVPATKKLNIKRRRLLIYIRRALRLYDNNRRLPLDVRKHSHNQKVAKLKGFTILG